MVTNCLKGNRFSAIKLKCSEENVILRGIFHGVQYLVFLYISCFTAEMWITFLTVCMYSKVPAMFFLYIKYVDISW